jgi:hypothetical protein
MKKIKFPKGPKNGRWPVPGGELGCADIITKLVLTTPFWKNESILKRVEANLAIGDEVEKNPYEPVISDDEHGILVDSMSMQNGAVQIQEPQTNRIYMLTFKAVLRAEDVDERSGAPQKPG